ncbi:DNA-directed RNA polymerase subunit H [archaeon]|nr:DNA-directed RNA polymerase subunit H [archaeon]
MKKKQPVKIETVKHVLVPKHLKLTEEEKGEILKTYNVSSVQLPKILKNDPAIKGLKAIPGDVIKIFRKSKTAKHAPFYREVI